VLLENINNMYFQLPSGIFTTAQINLELYIWCIELHVRKSSANIRHPGLYNRWIHTPIKYRAACSVCNSHTKNHFVYRPRYHAHSRWTLASAQVRK